MIVYTRNLHGKNRTFLNPKQSFRIVRFIQRSFILLLTLFCLSGCFDNTPFPEHLYTFKGQTAADYLKSHESLSKFKRILERTQYLDLLSIYGNYTCLALTNDAVDSLLHEDGLTSVEQLSRERCDTIAMSHLLNETCFMNDGELDRVHRRNMLDWYLVFSYASQTINGIERPGYVINRNSRFVHLNDTVTNGVVHILNKALDQSRGFINTIMEDDNNISIFTKALKRTGIFESMQDYLDADYSYTATSSDNLINTSINLQSSYFFMKYRYFGYTVFVEPDTLYHKQGIYSVDDLIEHLRSGEIAWNDPKHTLDYGTNYGDTTNFLYQYVAYHILKQKLPYERNANKYVYYGLKYSNANVYVNEQINMDRSDPYDYFETMCPFKILKVQSPIDNQCYINRRRILEGAFGKKDTTGIDIYEAPIRGCRILSPSEMHGINNMAINGYYYYIDDILTYNDNTVDALKTRIRFDEWSLSPDFVNNTLNTISDIPLKDAIWTNNYLAFRPGSIRNFKFNANTKIGIHPNFPGIMWMKGLLNLGGDFDLTIKLPPVPEGMYEIRVLTHPNSNTLQYYLDGKACGGPVKLGIIDDFPELYDIEKDTWSKESEDESTLQLDKLLRHLDIIRSPDAFGKNTSSTSREIQAVRFCITRTFLNENETHYLRIKKLEGNANFMIDFIEFCPESIYNNPLGEDPH